MLHKWQTPTSAVLAPTQRQWVLDRGDESAKEIRQIVVFPSAKAHQKRTTILEGCSMSPSIDSPQRSFSYGVGDDAFQSPAEHVRSQFKLSLVRIRHNIRESANARHAWPCKLSRGPRMRLSLIDKLSRKRKANNQRTSGRPSTTDNNYSLPFLCSEVSICSLQRGSRTRLQILPILSLRQGSLQE
jgi:hypothetical protein